jgi:3-oxoadipate enol-lactonase
VLFISGTGGDLRVKPNMFDGPLPKSFEVVSYDQRGLGQSEKPNWPYTMGNYAEDAVNLMEVGGWDKCHVIGYSFGGMVAQELAIRYPEKVDKLVLCSTSPGGEGGSSYPLHELAEMPVKHQIRIGLKIADTRHDDAWQAANPDAVVEYARQIGSTKQQFGQEHHWAIGRENQLIARKQHNCWASLNHIAAPTLICGGKYDGNAVPASHEAMASRIPNARLEFFEGGHLFIAEDRTAYTTIIDFLNEDVS